MTITDYGQDRSTLFSQIRSCSIPTRTDKPHHLYRFTDPSIAHSYMAKAVLACPTFSADRSGLLGRWVNMLLNKIVTDFDEMELLA